MMVLRTHCVFGGLALGNGRPAMDAEDKRRLFTQLVSSGMLDEEDRLFWKMITLERARRMLQVLDRRTGYVSVVLEAVDSGHNQAAVLRSADAFGVQHVSIVQGETGFAPHQDITQGAQKWLTLHRYPTVQDAIRTLRDGGYRIWASRLDADAVPMDRVDLSQPVALLFGNEKTGVSAEALHLVDGTFIVPMVGFAQSLNVSVAAAITLFHVTQRARQVAGERYFLPEAERRVLFRHWLRTSTATRKRLARILDGRR